SDANQSASGASLPPALGTTALTLGGVPVPLIRVFPLQVDAQVPWELAGQSQAQLSIVTDDLNGNTVSVPLAQFSPGLYSADGTGGGQGTILINGTTTLAPPGQARRGLRQYLRDGTRTRVEPARHRRARARNPAGADHPRRDRHDRRRAGGGHIRRARARLGRTLSGERAGTRQCPRGRRRAGSAQRGWRGRKPGNDGGRVVWRTDEYLRHIAALHVRNAG